MFAHRSISRIVSGLFVLVFTLALARPAQATYAPLAEPAKAAEAPTLLQFTSGGHVLGFTSQGMYAATGSHALRVDFVGANPVMPLSADSDSQKSGNLNGLENAAAPLTTVTYPNLWDGVTLTYDAVGLVRSTYRLEPYADPNAIRLHYNNPVLIQPNGSLQIEFETGSLTETAPIAWQELDGKRVQVDVTFRAINENEIGFALGDYNPAQPLFVDPTLIWNTFMGSSSVEIGRAIAVDGSGNVYVAGYSSANWGTPVNPHAGGSDAFAAKLNSSGVRQWNTFMGSSITDIGYGIAVDGSGNVYVTGRSDAGWGVPINPHAGAEDVFAARLDANGIREWNTFMGSSITDIGYGIAVDGSGNVYVAGTSHASWGTPINPHAGAEDAFAARLAANGALEWHTFMGWSGSDVSLGITVDGSGNVYVTGLSYGSWGAPINAHAGSGDAFAAKLNSSGVRQWHTFMGSSSYEQGNGIAVDGSGKVYVTGQSFASWGAPVNSFAGNDAFAARLDANGIREWNTFMGSSSNDTGFGIAVDGSGNVYVAGISSASWGTPVNPHAGGPDAFAARLDANGIREWNTFMGSSSDDTGFGIAVDGSGIVYVAGVSYGSSWGTPINAHAGGSGDAFAAKISQDTIPPTVSSIVRANPDPTTAASVNFTVTFSEPVVSTSVDISDFALSTSGITGAAVSGVSGSGATYTVSVDTGAGSGTIRLDLMDDDSITDLSSNPLGGVGNGDFITGEYYTILGPVLYATQGGMTTGFCNNWANACELRYALSIAESGKQIWVAAGTHKPTSGTDRTATFTLKNSVAIYGGFDGTETLLADRDYVNNVTILSGDLSGNDGANFANNGENSYHVVTGGGTNSTAILDGFTVTAGNANGSPNSLGGGMYNNSSSPSLTNLSFNGSSAIVGGGMYNINSNPILTNVTFSGNTAFEAGGMYNYSSSNPSLTNVTFSGNTASTQGGGMVNVNSSPTLTEVTFSVNSATNDYGGGMVNYSSSPSLTKVDFNGNSAGLHAGGMYNNNSSPTLTNVTFSNNSASAAGGMYNYNNSNPILTDVIFNNNTAPSGGGGMSNFNSSPILTNVTFSNNTSGTHGGGMANESGSPSLTDVSFVNNTAQVDGGGMFNYISSNPSLTNVTFSGNSADTHGGGMTNHTNSSPTLTNVTFNDNTAASNGGGMFNYGNSNPTLSNVTFHGNSATNGGGIANESSNPNIRNSILWGNNTQIFNVSSTPAVSDSIVQGGYSGGTNLINADPLLGALANNGGFTQTMSLGAGSAAIDAGSNATCATTDQRGVARPQPTGGTCDIGAYEYEYTPFTGIGYVKWDATGANNGTSWADAYTDLQSALVAASNGAEIWVAAGTYYPTSGINRTVTFTLKNGVAIYGGFDGTETLLGQRDFVANVTTLSGDLGNTVLNFQDNSYHVVTSNSVNSSAILDGFTVTMGHANGIGLNAYGGGMINLDGSPNLINLIFNANGAIGGGGLYNTGTLIITNSNFYNNTVNTAAGVGGGIYNVGTLTLDNTRVSGNYSLNIGSGGGIYNSNLLTLNNSIVSGNSASAQGGGIFNEGTAVLNYSTVEGNELVNIETAQGGGGIANHGALTLNFSTISYNMAEIPGFGAGIYNFNTLTMNTSTVSGNIGTYGGGVYNNNGTVTLNYSTVANNTSENTVAGDSGGISGGTIILNSSLVAGNKKGMNGLNDPNADCSGSVTSEGHNLTGSGTGCNLSGTGDVTVTPANVFTDVLAVLADNGGATQTHALIPGSSNPALNAIPSGTSDCGTAPIDQDQRGEPRPFPVNGNCDIGAYESQFVNSAPVVTEGDSVDVTMSEDGSPTSFALTLNATDTDGDTLNWSISNPATRGTASVGGTGSSKSISYTPNLDYNGSDSFEVRVDDSSLADTITVDVTIDPINDAPVITEGDSIHVTMSENGAPIPFALTLNATDVEGQTLSWIIPPPFAPLHGVATVSGTGTSKAIQYTPNAGYFGTDSFVVSVDDGFDRDLITVNVTINQVNEPPVITEGASVDVTMSEDGSPTAFDLTLDATDPDGDPLTWSISTPANNGTAIASGTGLSKSIDYTPIAGYSGTDSFDVQVSDGNGGTDTITVNVTVEAVNDAPVITEGASVTVTMSEDGSPTAFDLTLNATDPDGDTLTWSISSPAGNGTATASDTGLSKVIGYSPGADYNGSDSFDVRVSDANGATDTITVNVTIDPINDAPVITEGDSVNVTMSQNGSPTAFDLTLNATDIDNSAAALNWSISTPASNGTAVASGTGASQVIGYTPTPGYSGTDSFDVRLDDGNLSDFITVNVTIRPMLTVSANLPTITYGDAEPSFTPAYSGFVGGDNSAVLDTQPTCGVAGPHTDAGVYTIICSGGVDDTYDFTYVDGTLTVSKAALTVTAIDKSIIYGESDPGFTIQYSGFVAGDTFADLDTEPTCGVSGAHTDTGVYTISCSGGVDNNYDFTYVNGTLTIAQVTLTVTADDPSIVYGGAEPTFTLQYSGFVGSDTFADLDTQPTCGVAGAHTDAGTYTITCSGGADNNYDFTYVNGTLTIAQVTLTVTADDPSIVYGGAEPIFSLQYSGFVGSDTFTDLDTQPTCGVAGAHTDAGTYTITCSGGADNNYDFTYVDGTLTITKVTLTVTADDPSIVYGGAEPTFTLQYSGFVGSDTFTDLDTQPTCGVAGAHTDAGTYTITCSGGVDNNYDFTYVDGTLTVDPRPITVTADAQSKVYGEPDPVLLSYTFTPALVSGDSFSGALTRDPGENVGTYAITQGTLTAGTNYDLDFISADLTITLPPDLIFMDGFESGNFSAWSTTVIDPDLSITSAAALVGSRGMQVIINNNPAVYITDNTPNAEPRYRVRFYFDPNSIAMGSGNSHYIFYGNSGTNPVVRVEFQCASGACPASGSYQLRAAIRNDGGGWTGTTPWITITDSAHFIEIDWRASTAPGMNNGALTFWIDGVQHANITGIDNDQRRIDSVQLGAVNGVQAGTRGTYFFDDFESRTLTYIGGNPNLPPPPPLPDLIFADSFESGNFSAWSTTVIDPDLSVTSAAALAGSNGLQAFIDNNAGIYLTDNSPNAEALYRARFYFDPNSIRMARNNKHFIFYGISGTNTPVVRIELKCTGNTGTSCPATASYQLQASIRNGNGWMYSSWFTISDASHAIELDWRASTSLVTPDGSLTFWIDGVQQANITGVNNAARRIDSIRLGVVNGVNTGTRGTYYFDAFESRRQTYIGP